MSSEDNAPDSSDFQSPVAHGRSTYGALRWVLASAVVQRVVSISCLAIIARLISRDSYGIFRELLSLHLICFVLLPLGFDQLYLREVAHRAKFARAMQATVAISAIATSIIVFCFGEWIARRLDLQEYGYLLYAFPIALFVQAAKLPSKIELASTLNFRRISVGEFLNTVATMAGGAVLLFWWRSPAALYVTYVVGEILESLYLRSVAPVAFAPRESLRALRDLGGPHWKFALFSSGDQALNAISANAPVLILGGALSHASAATFSMASSLITMPLFLLVGALARIALPSLAGRTEQDLQERTLEILSAAAGYIVPVLIAVAIFAQPIVTVILGRTWVEQTAILVQLLAGYCIFVALFSAISSLDVLRDRMDLGFIWNVATFLLRLAALTWGQQYGIVQAIAAYAAVSAVMWLINGFVLGWLLRCGMWRFHATWLKFVPLWFGLAIVCAACTWLAGAHAYLALALAVIPAALYLLAIHLLYPSTGRLMSRFLLSSKVQSTLAMLRRGESTDPTGGSGAGIP